MKENKIKNFQRFYNEVNALKTLDHPHIIKLFEIYEDDENVYLVQELCTGGELFDFIVEKKRISYRRYCSKDLPTNNAVYYVLT